MRRITALIVVLATTALIAVFPVAAVANHGPPHGGSPSIRGPAHHGGVHGGSLFLRAM